MTQKKKQIHWYKKTFNKEEIRRKKDKIGKRQLFLVTLGPRASIRFMPDHCHVSKQKV